MFSLCDKLHGRNTLVSYPAILRAPGQALSIAECHGEPAFVLEPWTWWTVLSRARLAASKLGYRHRIAGPRL